MEKKAERAMMRMLFRGKDDAFSLLETVLFIFIISMLLLGLDAAVLAREKLLEREKQAFSSYMNMKESAAEAAYDAL